ncbi:MAG: thioredoxin [Gemmatimonadota bacterium]
MTENQAKIPVTVRCPFCLTLNRIDLARAADRPTCGKCGRPLLLDRPMKVEEEDFSRTVLESKAPVLVDFYADWCAPCKMVAPVVDELAQEYTGRLLVAKVDTDRAQSVAQEYGIRGIPTLILFKDGEEFGRTVGFNPEEIRSLAARSVA